MNSANKIQSEILYNTYKDIQERIKSLEQVIDELTENMNSITNKVKVELESLKKQEEKINEQIIEFKTNNGMSDVNDELLQINQASDTLSNDQTRLQQEINSLKETKELLQTSAAKKVVSKSIESKQAKLEKLKNKEVKLESRQRVILMNKQKVVNKRNEMLSKQEAKLENTNEKIADNMILRNTLDDSFKDRMVDKLYDIKGKFYQKQQQHQSNVLEIMKNNNVGFKGANVMLVKKTACNTMRNSIKAISIIKNNIKDAYNNAKQELNQMLQDGNENVTVNANSMSM